MEILIKVGFFVKHLLFRVSFGFFFFLAKDLI